MSSPSTSKEKKKKKKSWKSILRVPPPASTSSAPRHHSIHLLRAGHPANSAHPLPSSPLKANHDERIPRHANQQASPSRVRPAELVTSPQGRHKHSTYHHRPIPPLVAPPPRPISADCRPPPTVLIPPLSQPALAAALPVPARPSAKVASSALPTTTGSLTLTSLFPPSLQPYVLTTLTHLNASLATLTTRTGLPPAALLLTLLALALPLAMWSYWSKRPALSPWASMTQGRGAPDVTDEDYSYITSQDLDDRRPPEDDVLLVKHRGRTEEARFPAYSIGDGKLLVHDIRDRVGLMLDMSEAQTRRVRLFYKGRQLKEPGALARDYGVKNMSEILAMVREDPDEARYGEEEVEDASSHGGSSVGTDKSKRRKSRKSKKKPQSPRPAEDGELDAAAAAHRDAQLDKLDEVAAYFETELEPLCLSFSREPPRDKAAREAEHRRLSETVLHHVILKLDGVEPNGDEVIRSRRKRMVKDMQGVLAGLDAARNGA